MRVVVTTEPEKEAAEESQIPGNPRPPATRRRHVPEGPVFERWSARRSLAVAAHVGHWDDCATLIDTVVVPAVGAAYPDRRKMLTISMTIDYTGAIVGQDAIAEGWVVRRGQSMCFCAAEVRAADGTLAATASLVYKVSRSTIADPAVPDES